MTFCSLGLTKYNDNPPPVRLYTNPWPFYRTRPFTELWEVSIEHLRWLWHADRGRFLLRTTGPIQFGICMCSTCRDKSFSRIPDYAPRTFLGTFSILLFTFVTTTCIFTDFCHNSFVSYPLLKQLCKISSRNEECAFCLSWIEVIYIFTASFKENCDFSQALKFPCTGPSTAPFWK